MGTVANWASFLFNMCYVTFNKLFSLCQTSFIIKEKVFQFPFPPPPPPLRPRPRELNSHLQVVAWDLLEFSLWAHSFFILYSLS